MRPRLHRLLYAAAAGALVLAVGVGLAALLHIGPVGATTSLSLPAAAVAAQAQDGITPISHMAAPGFRLLGQNGRPLSLNSLRGKAVILTFLDPVCWDQCPLQAQEMKLSLRYLPASARSRVALVAVAANNVVHSLSAVRAFDQTEHLNGLGNWHFVTSPSLAALSRVWRAYYVAVSATRDDMVDHTLCFYLIAPNGQVRYLSEPSDATSAFVGTSEVLAAYTARMLGVVPQFPAGGPAPASLLPHFATTTAAALRASEGVTMRTPRRGWRVTRRNGFEILERTTDGGRTWSDVSPAGVTKLGGVYAAFGSGGQAWVVVLPWGYTHTPVTFYTADWGTTWQFTGVWPAGAAASKVDRPLVANGGTAYWLNARGLFRASGVGAWVRLGAPPASVPRGAVLTALAGGGVRLEARTRSATFSQGRGWVATGP